MGQKNKKSEYSEYTKSPLDYNKKKIDKEKNVYLDLFGRRTDTLDAHHLYH